MMKKTITTLAALLLFVLAANAQSRGGLRINEVMIENEGSVVDDYGNHSAWIELFNTNFAPLEISKVYITDDKANPTKYAVPIGDTDTRIPKREYVLFWADGEPNRGTFHTNFKLNPYTDNYIAIYDADGKTLIDEVVIPLGTLMPGQSYARISDGHSDWQVRHGNDLTEEGHYDYITPAAPNVINTGNDKVQFFSEQDENGFGLTIIAMGIVFSALLLVCLCFYAISKIGAWAQTRRKEQVSAVSGKAVSRDEEGKATTDTGEEIAAIVMALHEHLNAHDLENTILTLSRVKRTYSPWSSKIYNMRQLPTR